MVFSIPILSSWRNVNFVRKHYPLRFHFATISFPPWRKIWKYLWRTIVEVSILLNYWEAILFCIRHCIKSAFHHSWRNGAIKFLVGDSGLRLAVSCIPQAPALFSSSFQLRSSGLHLLLIVVDHGHASSYSSRTIMDESKWQKQEWSTNGPSIGIKFTIPSNQVPKCISSGFNKKGREQLPFSDRKSNTYILKPLEFLTENST